MSASDGGKLPERHGRTTYPQYEGHHGSKDQTTEGRRAGGRDPADQRGILRAAPRQGGREAGACRQPGRTDPAPARGSKGVLITNRKIHMSVLIFIDHSEGHVKKASLEALSYGAKVAEQMGIPAEGVLLGTVTEDL